MGVSKNGRTCCIHKWHSSSLVAETGGNFSCSWHRWILKPFSRSRHFMKSKSVNPINKRKLYTWISSGKTLQIYTNITINNILDWLFYLVLPNSGFPLMQWNHDCRAPAQGPGGTPAVFPCLDLGSLRPAHVPWQFFQVIASLPHGHVQTIEILNDDYIWLWWWKPCMYYPLVI